MWLQMMDCLRLLTELNAGVLQSVPAVIWKHHKKQESGEDVHEAHRSSLVLVARRSSSFPCEATNSDLVR